ncbi:MAG: hypothetical protein E5X63_26510 [Mesorhizobium sp.]|nr:MAG: hypothetical protein E5X63_26510 [Mesorhizobium sp.]
MSGNPSRSRSRIVPYRLYALAPLSGAYPVILVSHGIGGLREAMPYLVRRLAESGYMAVHLQHTGTDSSIWQHANSLAEVCRILREAMWDANAARARFQDVPFALRELARMNGEGRLAGRLDLTPIGMAGHSYGGVSTMVAAGQRMGPGGQWFFKEPRIRAGLVMSPNIPVQGGELVALYRDMRIPQFTSRAREMAMRCPQQGIRSDTTDPSLRSADHPPSISARSRLC